MAQSSELYVDPSIAGDSGAGTSGDPYGDLEYAIEQTTFDTTNGTRVNIKAGTDEILAVVLETALADTGTSVAWVPSNTAPLIFQGYTTTAGDGGIGGIDGNGVASILGGGTYDYTHFIDLHLHNTTSHCLNLDNECSVIRCEVNNAGADGISSDNQLVALSNYVHDCSGYGIYGLIDLVARYNYLANGTKDFSTAIASLAAGAGDVSRNIIKVDGTSGGIWGREGTSIINNSVYSAAGSGSGILVDDAGAYTLNVVSNNIVEGFSAAGGVGFDLVLGSVRVYGGNSAYDNETEYTQPVFVIDSIGGYTATDGRGALSNEILGASAFTDTTDFSPVDTGSVKEGHVPTTVGDGN